jgi:hypothetical protein
MFTWPRCNSLNIWAITAIIDNIIILFLLAPILYLLSINLYNTLTPIHSSMVKASQYMYLAYFKGIKEMGMKYIPLVVEYLKT